MFDRILIPLDGATQTESALDCALAIARRRGSQLRLVSVVSNAWGPGEIPGLHKNATRYLERTSARLGSQAKIEFTIRVGDPASEILSEVRDSHTDLVIIPDRSTGSRAPGDLGRVTSRVLLGAPVPVLLTRMAAPVSGKLDQQVMVMLDGSRLAEESIRPAGELARLCQGSVKLVTLLTEEPTQFGNSPTRWGPSPPQRAQATRYLDRFVESPLLSGLDVTTDALEAQVGPFIASIAAPAKTVVALTARGASGFSRWVLGGVADQVSRAAPATTLIVPPRIA